MSHIPAQPDTFGLQVTTSENEEIIVSQHPVVGWTFVQGHVGHPIYAAAVNTNETRAILFPNGFVTDRQAMASFKSIDGWKKWVRNQPLKANEPSPSAKSASSDSTPEFRSEWATPLGELDLSGRAVKPLARMGVRTLLEVAVQSREDIADVSGVSVESMKKLDAFLEEVGLHWDFDASAVSEPGKEVATTDVEDAEIVSEAESAGQDGNDLDALLEGL